MKERAQKEHLITEHKRLTTQHQNLSVQHQQLNTQHEQLSSETVLQNLTNAQLKNDNTALAAALAAEGQARSQAEDSFEEVSTTYMEACCELDSLQQEHVQLEDAFIELQLKVRSPLLTVLLMHAPTYCYSAIPSV